MGELSVNNIDVVYDKFILAVKGVSLKVPEGKIVALLGANGAGKSTVLKAISGILYRERGEITKGSITYDGQQINGKSASEITRMGIVQVMEGRRVFEHLTVEENLLSATYVNRRPRIGLEQIYEYFPILRERRKTKAGYLSGGEQQMLAIGRALMCDPKVLLLDEPSLGLAPMIIRNIYDVLLRINREEGVSILLVEQNAVLALNVSDYGYVMENGRIVMDGPAKKLAENEDIKEFYLGLSSTGRRKSYKDVKFYKRRKRWLS